MLEQTSIAKLVHEMNSTTEASFNHGSLTVAITNTLCQYPGLSTLEQCKQGGIPASRHVRCDCLSRLTL